VSTVRKGTNSSAQDNIIGPQNVTGVTSTNVGSGRAYNDGRIDVSWTNPSAGNTPTGYKVYDGATLKATISHPTNTAQITGLTSNTSYTFTVKAYDDYAETSGVSASAVTATTVPATPSAPSASTQGSAANDDVSWSAPADGGSAITGYHWESTDSKSGDTGSTSVTVAQEAGTAQQYRVYATNANGNSEYSGYSSSVTTFSFTPFSFAPFGAFGFTPFGAFGFTPFGAFGFTPFGFTPFGFTPYGFSQGGGACIEADTLVRTPSGLVAAKNINVGDKVTSVSLSEVPTLESSGDFDYTGFTSPSLTSEGIVEVDVVDIVASVKGQVIYFNGESDKKYSATQPMFIKREGSYEIVPTMSIVVGDILIKVNEDGSFTESLIVTTDAIYEDHTVYQFSCEPQDWFIAGDYLVHNK
jgi:hypothetical protein